MSAQPTRDRMLGVDYVAVGDEPDHVELFRTPFARVYLATIRPGAATLFHRHDLDTLYVVLEGGRFRSDEPGKQRPRTRAGRSTKALTKLGWLLRRTLGADWLRMPPGTLLVQPHAEHPFVHRVLAHPRYTRPVRMVGIELNTQRPLTNTTRAAYQAPEVEFIHPAAIVRHVELRPGEQQRFTLQNGGVLIRVSGSFAFIGTCGKTDDTPATDLTAGAITVTAGDAGMQALLVEHR